MIRASRAQRVRGLGGPLLNLTPASQNCPPGYHWVNPTGPIQGVRRMGSIAECVKNPTITMHLHTASPAPVPVLPAAVVAVAPTPTPTQATVTMTSKGSNQQPLPDAAPAPEESPGAAPACGTCWPWWWLLVAAAAGGGVAYAVRKGGKKKKGDARRLNPTVARLINAVGHRGMAAGTHHVIRAVMR